MDALGGNCYNRNIARIFRIIIVGETLFTER